MAKKVFHHDVADVVRLTKSYVRNRETERKAIDSPIKISITGSDTKLVEDMFLRLVLVGIKEFAPYLADSFEHGYGVKKDQFLADLIKLIGHKLGSEIEDISNFSVIIQELAIVCVEQIRQNIKKIDNIEISYEEAIRCGRVLDEQVKIISQKSGETHSYYNSIPSVSLHEIVDTINILDLDVSNNELSQSHIVVMQQEKFEELQKLEQLSKLEEQKKIEELKQKELEELQKLEQLNKLEEQRKIEELKQKELQNLDHLVLHEQTTVLQVQSSYNNEVTENTALLGQNSVQESCCCSCSCIII